MPCRPAIAFVRSRGRGLLPAVLLCAAASACGSPTDPQPGIPIYDIVEGACGRVLFDEHVGPDSAAVLAEVRRRKVEEFGEGGFVLDLLPLSVVDDDGVAPEERFYGVEVLDPAGGTHLHSVHEVLTTRGDLFILSWCPD